MFLESIVGITSLILFFLGSYKFIKDYSKINILYIPLIVNLAIILLLYVAGLIGLLNQAVWIILILGVGYFIFSSTENIKILIALLKSKIQSIKELQNKKGIFYLLIVVFLSITSSLAFLTRNLDFWSYDTNLQIVFLILIASIQFFPLYIILNKIINSYKLKYFKIISFLLILLTCVIFIKFFNNNDYFAPSVDSIIIKNSGLKNGDSSGNEIIFIEIKKSDTKEILEFEENVNWIEIDLNNANSLKSINSEDYLIFNNTKKGSAGYQILFLESPSSGIAEIIINGGKSYYDSYNPNGYNLRVIEFTSNYNFRDLSVLFSGLIYFIIIFQILLYYVYSSLIIKNGKYSSYELTLIFLIIFIVLFLLTKSLKFYNWDEFSHWGIFVKELHIKNILPIKNFCTGGPQYIPGISLFEYFFTKNLGYKEGYVYFAYSFFIFTELITFIGKLEKRKILIYLLTFSSIIIFLFYLPIYFFSLYADAALGLLFGAGIIIGLNSKLGGENKTILFFIFCGLQLIKTWGLVFAAILLIIKLYSIFLDKKSNKVNKKIKQGLFYLFCFSISAIIIQIPWLIHINKINLGYVGSAIFNIDEWEKSLNIITEINKKDFLSGLIKIFFKGRQDYGLEKNLSPLKIGIYLLVIGIFSSRTRKDLNINILLFCLYLFDVTLLCYPYLFYFSRYEAIRYASLERYISEFLLGWFLFQVSKLIENEIQIKKHNIYYSIKYIVFTIFIVMCLLAKNKIHWPSKDIIGERENVQYLLEKYSDDFSIQEEPLKIFHIEQDSNGFTHHILRYELCPNLVQYWGWSIGEPYRKNDLFTINYDVDELKKKLVSNFDYVLIKEIDSNLIEKYGTIFPGIKNSGDQLFKIKDGDIIPME